MICGSKENLRVGHRYPLSKGGLTVLWNLIILCERCWRAKRDKTPEDFLHSPYVQFEILKRALPEVQTKKVKVILDNGQVARGEMRLDPTILEDFCVRLKGKGMVQLLPRRKIKQIYILDDLTD